MCSFKVSVFATLFLVAYVSAAAKPLDLDEIGRKIKSFKDKAIPAFQGLCGFVNGYTGYPTAYPQGFSPGYYQGYPPQGYPQIQGYYPPMSNTFPQNPQSLAPSQHFNPQQTPTGNAFENGDLINFNPQNNINNPPPQIQDILKNFDKLPKFDTSNTDKAENLI